MLFSVKTNLKKIKGLFTCTQLTGLARSYKKFQPGFQDGKRQKILERVLPRNSRNKANLAKHKVITFMPVIALATLITAVKWDAYDVENTAGNARRCHPGQPELILLSSW